MVCGSGSISPPGRRHAWLTIATGRDHRAAEAHVGRRRRGWPRRRGPRPRRQRRRPGGHRARRRHPRPHRRRRSTAPARVGRLRRRQRRARPHRELVVAPRCARPPRSEGLDRLLEPEHPRSPGRAPSLGPLTVVGETSPHNLDQVDGATGGANGSFTVKRAPPPSTLAATIVPPWASAISRTT